MVEVHVPKEINQYESKLLGPLTSRQLIVCLIFGPIIVFFFNLVYQNTNSIETAVPVILPFAVIAGLFGWVKPYGMKFEVFLRSVFINVVIAPSKRLYVTNNYHEQFSDLVLTNEVMEEIEKDLEEYGNIFSKKEKKEKADDYVLEDYYFDREELNKIRKEKELSNTVVKSEEEMSKTKEKKKKKDKKGKEKNKKKEKYIKSDLAIK